VNKRLFSKAIPLFLFSASLVLAQSRKIMPNSTKISEIRVVGSQRFQSHELAPVTGLKIGDTGDDAALKQAADNLAESGMFSNVTYSYISSPDGTRVKFEVLDTEKLLPIHVDNFVWLSSAELLNELQKREPLFRGGAPNAGEMYTKLADDMTAILNDMHISGTVRAFPQAPSGGGDVTGFLYSVSGVNLPVRNVEFPGASADMTSVLQKIAATTLIDTNYSRSKVNANAQFDFLPQYQMRGFLKAAFGDPVVQLQDRSTGAVTVQVPVKEGLQYKLSAVQWAENMVFSNNDLSKPLRCKPGQALNQLQLEEDLGGISKIYGTRGYMEAHLVPKFTFDDAAQTVNTEIDVHEGDQYHIGEVQFAGMTESAAAPLRKLWKLHPGDPYDSSYPPFFLTQAAMNFDLSHMKISVDERPRRETKTVDVTFHFTKAGS
jgi:outer membrane protein assembly factor BamA